MKCTIQNAVRPQTSLGFRSLLVLLASVCSIIVAQGVSAPLAPGGFVFPPPVGVNPTGTLLATTTTPFLSASLNGTLISQVFSNDTTSLRGGLTFTYQIVL